MSAVEPTDAELQVLGAAGLVAEREGEGWGLWNLTDAQLSVVEQLPTLHALVVFETCESGVVTDRGLAVIGGHAGLRQLDLGPGITDAGLVHVAGLRSLRRLRLDSAAGVTDAGLEHVAQLEWLEMLSLQYTGVTDAGVARLSHLVRLREFELNDTHVTDAVMPHLVRMQELERLSLGNQEMPAALRRRLSGGITDAALARLPGHPRLSHLSLAGAFTPAGLAALGQLPQLATLLVRAGLEDSAVPVLSALRGLKQLYVMDHRMTPAGVAALKGALPGCAVIADRLRA